MTDKFQFIGERNNPLCQDWSSLAEGKFYCLLLISVRQSSFLISETSLLGSIFA